MRTYSIGLPVEVTIHDDGTVTVSVDTSEIAVSLGHDDESTATDAEIEADGETADNAHRAGFPTLIVRPAWSPH